MGKIGAGRGNKDGLSEYARVVTRPRTQLMEWRKAALVFDTVKNCQKENSQNYDNFNPINFIDKHSHLAAIHAAPSESWPALCDYLITGPNQVAKVAAQAQAVTDNAAPEHRTPAGPTLPLPKAVMSVSPSKTRKNLARI